MTLTLTEAEVEAAHEREAARDRLNKLLDQLPAESLPVVEAFLRFLNRLDVEQKSVVLTEPQFVEDERPSDCRPTVIVAPISTLREVIDILPDGYTGDALSDTQVLYDEI